jgi:2-dehydro-3-deoxyphosphogluconate aldolase/(4S)-4-hydroxy-2-oxoglutarate aldolase
MNLLKPMLKEKLIAIVRGIPEECGDAVAEALYQGGIRFMEVTMNTPGAVDMIRRWRNRYGPQMFVGAGTVLDVSMAKAAVEAGAQYLITPNVDESVIRYGVDAGVDVFPGAMTPTEIVQAWKFGAAAVKVFPAASLGAQYFKELQGPLSHIPLIATGGVHLENMEEFAKAGSRAFGLGGNLVNKAWIREGDFERLKEQAKLYVETAKRL